MKKFFKENRQGIVQSLIASVIFFILLEPLIHITQDVLSKGAIALVDYFFYSCAHADGINILITLTTLVLALFTGHMITDMAKNLFVESHKREKQVKELIKELPINKQENSANQENHKEKEQNQESTVQEREKEVAQIADMSIKMYQMGKKVKKWDMVQKGLSIACIIIYILFFLNTMMYQCVPVMVKSSFDRCITQITPYVENAEIEILQSDWTRMESKDDYDKIAERINCIQEENNLK